MIREPGDLYSGVREHTLSRERNASHVATTAESWSSDSDGAGRTDDDG